jgi:release factor glutamine methyltransferase
MQSDRDVYDELRRIVAANVVLLPDKPEETIDTTLRALWCAAAGCPRSAELAAQGELPSLDTSQRAMLKTMVLRRCTGVPLPHITGRQRFMEMEMLASPEALIPRKETELLARAAIERAQESSTVHASTMVLDVCTGAGNVAFAVARNVAAARVFAADLSEAAVNLARRNARHLDLERVEFRQGDLLAPFDEPRFLRQVDVLACNPPYINTAKVSRMPHEIAGHEPNTAFDGGPLGIGVLMRLLREAPRFLRSGGWLVFEAGLGQAAPLLKRISSMNTFGRAESYADGSGAMRVVFAQCQ